MEARAAAERQADQLRADVVVLQSELAAALQQHAELRDSLGSAGASADAGRAELQQLQQQLRAAAEAASVQAGLIAGLESQVRCRFAGACLVAFAY